MNFKHIYTLSLVTLFSINANCQNSTYIPPASIAEYPSGGMMAFYQYVYKTMVYPQTALDSGIVGRVYVQFEIDSVGNIVKESVLVGNTCPKVLHEEAMRLVKESGIWIPAKDKNGASLNSRLTIPIIFTLPEDNIPEKKKSKKKD